MEISEAVLMHHAGLACIGVKSDTFNFDQVCVFPCVDRLFAALKLRSLFELPLTQPTTLLALTYAGNMPACSESSRILVRADVSDHVLAAVAVQPVGHVLLEVDARVQLKCDRSPVAVRSAVARRYI